MKNLETKRKAKGKETKPRRKICFMGSLLLVPLAVGIGSWLWISSPRPQSDEQGSLAPAADYVRREQRPTLWPSLFRGTVSLGYAVAMQIPDVLDQLRCYCDCERLGHMSLLSCFTDRHAVG